MKYRTLFLSIFLLAGAIQIKAETATKCGPHCLLMVSDKFNKEIPLIIIENLSGFCPEDGTTMLGLYSASEKLGLPVVPLKMTEKQLRNLSDPAILLVDGNHYLVVHKAKWFGKYLIIEDPPKPKETVIAEEILKRWKGEALLYSKKVKKTLEIKEKNKPEVIFPSPHISVENEVHFLGTVPEGEKISGKFVFTNAGRDTLKVSARPSCSCTVGKLSKQLLLPGEKSEIEVTFDTSGRSGHQKHDITLITNDPDNKYINLMIALTVRK